MAGSTVQNPNGSTTWNPNGSTAQNPDSSVIRNPSGGSAPFTDANGNPMNTVISPRHNSGERAIPARIDGRTAAVTDEFDQPDGEEQIIFDDEPDGYNVMTNDTPKSGDQLH
ncbi:hypothetical protein L195_g051666, partial [Trifolium pratense]